MAPAKEKEGFFSNRSPAFWAVFSADIFFVFWIVLSVILFYSGGANETEQAIQNGQRYLIDVATGRLTGKLQPEKPKPKEEEPPSSLPSSENKPNEDSTQGSIDYGEFDVAESSGPKKEMGAPIMQAPADEPVTLLPRSVDSLNDAPAAELSEETTWGVIPRTGQIGSPKNYYSRAFIDSKTPHIAIVLSDVGTSRSLVDKVLTLPKDVTLVFNPYPKHTPDWVHNARMLGYEVWLGVPMQTRDYPASDPGPLALLKDLTPQDNLERFQRLMATFPGFVGVMLPQSESFSESDLQIRKIADEVFMRGLGFIYPDSKLNEELKKEAVRRSDSLLTAHLIIDETLTPESIDTQLKKLELEAMRSGSALGIVRAYPLTVEKIAKWSATLKEKKIMLAPASALFKR